MYHINTLKLLMCGQTVYQFLKPCICVVSFGFCPICCFVLVVTAVFHVLNIDLEICYLMNCNNKLFN
jgi:hypothetical protein